MPATHRIGTCLGLLLVAVAGVGCHRSQPTEIEMEVLNVGFDSAAHAPVVLLQDRDRKFALPIWIGITEAQSIATKLQGANPPRPLTHDLMKTLLAEAGVDLRKVVITRMQQGTYFANIHLHTADKDVEIDSRPSDAIALALRCQRPIFVATSLLTDESKVDVRRFPSGGASTVDGITVQNLAADVAEHFAVPPGTGVLVSGVQPGRVTDLRRGDVILEIDGVAVTSVGDFARQLRTLPPGHRARMSVHRDGERLEIPLATPAG